MPLHPVQEVVSVGWLLGPTVGGVSVELLHVLRGGDTDHGMERGTALPKQAEPHPHQTPGVGRSQSLRGHRAQLLKLYRPPPPLTSGRGWPAPGGHSTQSLPVPVEHTAPVSLSSITVI